MPTIGDLSADSDIVPAPTQAVEIELSLTTTPVEAKVGASPLTERRFVEIFANDKDVRWGYSTLCPFLLPKDGFISIFAGSTCTIYIRSAKGTSTAIVAEK